MKLYIILLFALITSYSYSQKFIIDVEYIVYSNDTIHLNEDDYYQIIINLFNYTITEKVANNTKVSKIKSLDFDSGLVKWRDLEGIILLDYDTANFYIEDIEIIGKCEMEF
jgi:hypothetical protein